MELICRGCLSKNNEPTDIFQYCEKNRRLFVYSTGLQVKRNDTFTFQLCKECYYNMKLSCKFKKQCRDTDKKFKHYLGLKEHGDNIDFSTYLNNVEDTLTLRLPVASRYNSPNCKKYDDDDNESTCTSIQNFMTDMLQGEEMAPTEARIIREVIQEEADISEDSLDSHWLQDDMSIDNDFEMDFNFSAFSTPRSINNDHCYTPRRITDEKEELNYYTSEQIIRRSDNITKLNVTIQQNDMPDLDDGITDAANEGIDINITTDDKYKFGLNDIESAEQQTNIIQESHIPLLDDCNTEFDGIVVEDQITLNQLQSDLVQSKEMKIAGDNLFVNIGSFGDNLLSDSISPFLNHKVLSSNETSNIVTNDNEYSIILKKGIAKKAIDSPLTKELKYYMNKVESSNINNECQANKINEKDTGDIHKGKEDKVSQLTFTDEISKSKKTIFPELNISEKELSIFTGGIKSINYVEQSKNDNQANLEFVDSPLKLELEQHVKKVEMKKNLIKVSKPESFNDSIDRNLELALKCDVSQEFSLDQLLVSPQASSQSGASTPTIHNILFGVTTPIKTGTNMVVKPPKQTQVPTDFLVEFFNHDNQNHSTPKKQENQEQQTIEETINIGLSHSSVIDKIVKKSKKNNSNVINNLADQELINKNTNKPKSARGFKDIKRLKELCKPDSIAESDSETETSLQNSKEIDQSISDIVRTEPDSDLITFIKTQNSEQNDETNLTGTETDTRCKDLTNSRNVNDEDIKDMAPKNIEEDSQIGDIDDLSLNNLLKCSDNDMIDLNISVTSDFLKPDFDDDKDFKRPFSPLDDKYDLEQCLCKACDIKFQTKKSLKLHFYNKHNFKISKTSVREYICQCCSRCYTDKSNFNRHLRGHEEQGFNTCNVCTLSFSTAGRLSQHMKVHLEIIKKNDTESKEKPICSTCGKQFASTANLNIHKRRHTKSYKCTCNVCQKGFFRASDLEQHMSTHTGDYRFQCKHCPKMYRRRSQYMGHMYRHLDKTKFRCDVCDVQFVNKHLLKRHYISDKCISNRKTYNAQLKQDHIVTVNVVESNEKIKYNLLSKQYTYNMETENQPPKEETIQLQPNNTTSKTTNLALTEDNMEIDLKTKEEIQKEI